MKISWRFVGTLAAAVVMVAQNPKSPEAWSAGIGIIMAGLSKGATKPNAA